MSIYVIIQICVILLGGCSSSLSIVLVALLPSTTKICHLLGLFCI